MNLIYYFIFIHLVYILIEACGFSCHRECSVGFLPKCDQKKSYPFGKWTSYCLRGIIEMSHDAMSGKITRMTWQISNNLENIRRINFVQSQSLYSYIPFFSHQPHKIGAAAQNPAQSSHHFDCWSELFKSAHSSASRN